MKKISVTGWVPEIEKESETLYRCELDGEELRAGIKDGLIANKTGWKYGPLKKVRVTVEIDVEELP